MAIDDEQARTRDLIRLLEQSGFSYGSRSATNLLLMADRFSVETLLKLSLAALFMRFRATACLTFFLAIANPNLACGKAVLIAKTVKYLSVDFTGFAKTFLKSAGVLSR
jgi:hypothetical protein